MGDSTVYLSLPGLLSSCVTPDALPDDAAPLWCRVLGTAVRDNSREPDTFLDIAGLSRLADFGELPEQPCWRCDPVYLQSDIAHVFLFDTVQRELAAEEAGELVRTFNDHFAGEGLYLEFKDPQRWYLFGLPSIDPHPHALTTLIGRDIQGFLPRDARLGRLLTEVQMLFHACPLNSRREARGKMPVNGVWIHGRGDLPAPGAVPWTSIYSDSASDHGLAVYTGVSYSRLPEHIDGISLHDRGTVLVRCDDALRAGIEGHRAWLEAVERLERSWLQPLWDALKRNEVDQLIIDDGETTRLQIDRRRARSVWKRFFRRDRPLREWVLQARS